MVGRAKIVLLAGDGIDIEEIARKTGFSGNAVYRWRHRHETRGIDGLQDEPRSGRPVELREKKVREILRRTGREIPHEATHWSLRLMAKYAGVSVHQVRRVWEAADLKPHRIMSFKISTDPRFAEKVRSRMSWGCISSLRTTPWSYRWARRRRSRPSTGPSPLLPVRPGQIERRTHDYARHGTRSLYAAFDIATGKVMGRVTKRHRAQEFLASLRQIDSSTEPRLDLHPITAAPTPRPRSRRSTSVSWLNAVESWFSQLERRALYRGVFTNVTELRDELHRNQEPAKPFRWTNGADSIIATQKRLGAEL